MTQPKVLNAQNKTRRRRLVLGLAFASSGIAVVFLTWLYMQRLNRIDSVGYGVSGSPDWPVFYHVTFGREDAYGPFDYRFLSLAACCDRVEGLGGAGSGVVTTPAYYEPFSRDMVLSVTWVELYTGKAYRFTERLNIGNIPHVRNGYGRFTGFFSRRRTQGIQILISLSSFGEYSILSYPQEVYEIEEENQLQALYESRQNVYFRGCGYRVPWADYPDLLIEENWPQKVHDRLDVDTRNFIQPPTDRMSLRCQENELTN